MECYSSGSWNEIEASFTFGEISTQPQNFFDLFFFFVCSASSVLILFDWLRTNEEIKKHEEHIYELWNKLEADTFTVFIQDAFSSFKNSCSIAILKSMKRRESLLLLPTFTFALSYVSWFLFMSFLFTATGILSGDFGTLTNPAIKYYFALECNSLIALLFIFIVYTFACYINWYSAVLILRSHAPLWKRTIKSISIATLSIIGTSWLVNRIFFMIFEFNPFFPEVDGLTYDSIVQVVDSILYELGLIDNVELVVDTGNVFHDVPSFVGTSLLGWIGLILFTSMLILYGFLFFTPIIIIYFSSAIFVVFLIFGYFLSDTLKSIAIRYFEALLRTKKWLPSTMGIAILTLIKLIQEGFRVI